MNTEDILEYIILYLDDPSINILTETSKKLLLDIQKIETKQSYWKKRYEILSGIVLADTFPNSDKVNWIDVVDQFTNSANLDDMFIRGLDNNNYSAVVVALASGVKRDGKPDLSIAVKIDNIDIVSLLLSTGAYTNENKNDALLKMCAQNYENIDIFKVILSDIKGPLTYGVLCFFSFIKAGREDIIDLILENEKFDLKSINAKVVLNHIVGQRLYKLENLLKYEIYGNIIGGMIIGYLAGSSLRSPLGGGLDSARKINISQNDSVFEWMISSLKPGQKISKDMLFYYNLIKYILNTNRNLLSIVQWMTQIASAESYAKKYSKGTIEAINRATHSVLNFKENMPRIKNSSRNKSINNLYFALRGFLLLSFQPQYRLEEILNMIRNEGASKEGLAMAGTLIGGMLGMNILHPDSKLAELKNIILQYLPKLDTKLLVPGVRRTLHHGTVEITSR
jgi:hypothetical protein